MSDTATATATQLTERIDAYYCMSLGLRTFCWLLLFLILSNLIVTCFEASKMRPYQIAYVPAKLKEEFNNEKVKFSPPQTFQRIPLTPPESNGIDHMYFGTANLHIIPTDAGATTLIFEIYANLPILGGNVYGKSTTDQFYSVKLIDEKTNKSITSKDIVRDNDGMYKLKYKTTNQQEIEEISKMKRVRVKYNTKDEHQIVMEGRFH